MNRPIRLHWSRSKPNFGDWLSPALCELISGRPVEYAKPNRCELMAVGSLLDRAREGFLSRRIHVWGSGFIQSVPAHKTRHYIHALRGHESRRLLVNVPDVPLGDPGLLSHLLLERPAEVSKQCRIGIVCHYKDKEHPVVRELTAMSSDIRELDVFLPPGKLIEAIAGCEVVLSSAMHPLIAADALQVPNAWIKLSQAVRGEDFKFRDYYSVFGITNPQPFHLDRALVEEGYRRIIEGYQRPGLKQCQDDLLMSFPMRDPGLASARPGKDRGKEAS